MFWSPEITPDYTPHKVLLKKGEFIDDTRQNDDGSTRVVPYKLYYPSIETSKKLPVIIWSHGFGGSREGAGFISRFIASQGYIIAHLSHHGTDSSLWEGKPGHPWDVLRKTKVSRTTSLNRFNDIPFFIDSLQNWAEDNPEIGELIDFQRLGMSGHSFGALSTQVAAGQLTPDDNESLISIAEPRIKAGILYSPVPLADHLLEKISNLGDTNIYEPISIPLLHMTGTDDSSPIGDQPYTHRLSVYNNTGHDERYLLVKNEGDHMVYNGTRGKLNANQLRDQHEELIKMFTLAFWEAKLNSNQKAQAWLDQNAEDYLKDMGEFKRN